MLASQILGKKAIEVLKMAMQCKKCSTVQARSGVHVCEDQER